MVFTGGPSIGGAERPVGLAEQVGDELEQFEKDVERARKAELDLISDALLVLANKLAERIRDANTALWSAVPEKKAEMVDELLGLSIGSVTTEHKKYNGTDFYDCGFLPPNHDIHMSDVRDTEGWKELERVAGDLKFDIDGIMRRSYKQRPIKAPIQADGIIAPDGWVVSHEINLFVQPTTES